MSARALPYFLAVASFVLAAAPSAGQGQYPADKVKLLKHFSVQEMGGGGGTTCWGYVSPSGREYAIMGLTRSSVIVEVTDPVNARIVATIPRTPSGWTDFKTFRHALYISAEGDARRGIQVVDLREIDQGIATVVRTINPTSYSHTLAVDEASGFMYFAGAGGSATMFDLNQDPLNPTPLPVHAPSRGMHESLVVTYTTGPYAGRQIMFGFGGYSGTLLIHDVTDKSNPRLIRTVAYPFAGYCHQGWLSDDRRYLYVNDEFDEERGPMQTRTLVFDVSVLETADLVSTFSTGRWSTDHNLYVKNDFVFQSNYTSGLCVFDANSDPIQPTFRGFFDTYPANDFGGYNGSWGNYPYFPSGIVAVSDRSNGLFIVDVSEATRTELPTLNFRLVRGKVLAGGLEELQSEDGRTLDVGPFLTGSANEAPVTVEFETTSKWQDVSRLSLSVRSRASTLGLEQTLELFDWRAGRFESVQTSQITKGFETTEQAATNPDRFVQEGTKRVLARVSFKPVGPVANTGWSASLDRAITVINP